MTVVLVLGTSTCQLAIDEAAREAGSPISVALIADACLLGTLAERRESGPLLTRALDPLLARSLEHARRAAERATRAAGGTLAGAAEPPAVTGTMLGAPLAAALATLLDRTGSTRVVASRAALEVAGAAGLDVAGALPATARLVVV